MAVELNQSEVDVLKRAVDENHKYYLLIIDNLLRSGTISSDDRLALENLLSNEFSRAGLEDDDEPNEYGAAIDDLIGVIAE